LLFAFFQYSVGGVTERRSQRSLRGAFDDILRSGVPSGMGKDGRLHLIRNGSPVALLELPDLGVHAMVVEGTDGNQLKRGPGHLRSSLLPGEPGHAVIVGRRTTYGAPFKHLNLLRAGDRIVATTPYGRFVFRVRSVRKLDPGKADNLQTSKNGLLSLATSDPPYAPHGALVVDSELTGDPTSFPNRPLASGPPGSVDFTGDESTLPGVTFFGILLFGAIYGAQTLYRRWRAWPTYLLTTPVIMVLLFLWMEGLITIMPSTL
jgi:sortase A